MSAELVPIQLERQKNVLGGTCRHHQPHCQAQMGAIRELVHSCRPLVMEIGFANGRFLNSLVETLDQTYGVMGFEIRRKWVTLLVDRHRQQSINHTALCHGDAKALIPTLIPTGRMDAIYVLFPDPWWKERHQKKRLLLTGDFIVELSRCLKPGGLLVIKTDVLRYADQVRTYAREATQLQLMAPEMLACSIPDPLLQTIDLKSSRESRCRQQGLFISKLVYQKRPSAYDSTKS